MPAHTAAHDPGGTLHLRPHSAVVICAVVGLIGFGLTLDAVLRAGWEGLLVLPVPLFVLALVWMVLWAPRVVLHEDEVEVRNVLVTHRLPFAAIQEVRVGAMLRFEVTTRRAATSTVTAWNAPALGRDAPGGGRRRCMSRTCADGRTPRRSGWSTISDAAAPPWSSSAGSAGWIGVMRRGALLSMGQAESTA